MDKLVFGKMYELHFHPRDYDEITEMVLTDLLESGFSRGIPVFNYEHPVETAWDLEREMKRLYRIAPKFEIVPSIMLTRNTTPETIRDVHSAGALVIKWIPDGLSTNSKNGVGWNNLPQKYPCYREAERLGMYSMNHVEYSSLDKFGNPITHPIYREALALRKFDAFARMFPDMPMTFEHVSTKKAVDYIRFEAPPNVRGTISPRYLMRTIFNVYKDGQKMPDEWCAPVYKYSHDRDALIKAAISGDSKFFYVSDDAPHRNKNPLDPPAGVYMGPVKICLTAALFEKYGALDKLNGFMSGGEKHYNLPPSEGKVILRKKEWIPPRRSRWSENFYGRKKNDVVR